MDRFYGFDLGDAESAVARLNKDAADAPQMLEIKDRQSFVTSYALTADGQILLGEEACYAPEVSRRALRFKSRFLKDPAIQADVRAFAAGVLGELYAQADLIKGEDCCFYVGCPAGWDKNTRERYRAIFERAGYPPTRIVSESRAAMVSACQSRHLQVGYDILSKPVLVVDIGSSTTDFAYIVGGKEKEFETSGEVALGGGLMDEYLLEMAVRNSKQPDVIRGIFEKSEAWKNYCEFKARRLKERYYQDEAFWQDNPCEETVLIRYNGVHRLVLKMDASVAKKLCEDKLPSLGDSFKRVFMDSLKRVQESIEKLEPEFIFLTGGVSKMPPVHEWVQEVFQDAVLISSQEPEFSVAKGLSYSGRIDEEMRAFRQELENLKDSQIVEKIVEENIRDLYMDVINALVDPILEEVAEPIFERWREGEIPRLQDTDEALMKEIPAFLRSERAAELMKKPIAAWMKPVARELETYTMPICTGHHIPYKALSLSGYLSVEDMQIQLDSKGLFAVGEITWLIDSIISVLVGLLCGGSGLALISSGPQGMLAGIAASLLVLALGKNKMESALLKLKLPRPMRRLVPKGAFRGRMKALSADIKKEFYESLKTNQYDEMTEQMVEEISGQIEMCLTKMAEVVEIPLG
ncbi:MAG: Hsp70 family protein [Firmicutes bacterium]|nr:Hsp70 family protein [Bacillota bacterium]